MESAMTTAPQEFSKARNDDSIRLAEILLAMAYYDKTDGPEFFAGMSCVMTDLNTEAIWLKAKLGEVYPMSLRG